MVRQSAVTRAYSLPIADIIRETAEAVSLRFAIPEGLRADYGFVPGQAVAVTADVPDAGALTRSYSISDYHGDIDAPSMLQITLKQQGRLSNYAAGPAQEGECWQVSLPQGKFCLPEIIEGAHYAMIAGGSGITPIVSHITHVLTHASTATVTLIAVSSYKAGIVFRERLEALKNRFLDRFNPIFITSRESQDVPLFSGRLDGEKLQIFLQNLIPAAQVERLLVSVPHGLAEIVKSEAQAAGYESSQILFERFGAPPKSGKTDTSAQADVPDDAAFVTLTFGGHRSEFVIHKAEGTILDVGLKSGLALPHGCKAGICSSCLALLEQGTVDMPDCEGLGTEEAQKGYILCCQAVPKSQNIHVNFDQ